MSRKAFREWAEGQAGHYERIAGEPVSISPERVAHARLKARIWQVLDREIRSAGLPCEALPDGITIEVGEDTDYEPDAVVNCGEPLPDDAVAASHPVVVVKCFRLPPAPMISPARWPIISAYPASSTI